MVEFFDPLANTTISYHIDDNLIRIWEKIRDGKLAKLNEDRVYIVDGRERTGKSSFAFQQAKYIDPTFDVDRICFKPEDFLYQIRHAKPGQVVVFDEAFRGLSSKASRSKVNKAIVEALMEVGQKNLIIFIVLPTIFLLEIYAAVFRSEALLHVVKNKSKHGEAKRTRGFKIYNYAKKRYLYLRGRTKYFSYAKPRITKARGKFFIKRTEEWKTGIPYATFNMQAYLAKKAAAFATGSDSEEDKEESKYKLQRDLIIKGMYEDFIKSYRKLAEWLETKKVAVGYRTIGSIVGETAENTDIVSCETGKVV